VSYAWSHTLDDSTGAFKGQTAALYYDPRASYGNSSQDQRQVFSSSILYLLPFGRGQRFGGNVSRPMDWLIGGWQTSLIALVQTGTPSGYWFNPASFANLQPFRQTARRCIRAWERLDAIDLRARLPCGQFQCQKNIHLAEGYTVNSTAMPSIFQLSRIHKSEFELDRTELRPG